MDAAEGGQDSGDIARSCTGCGSDILEPHLIDEDAQQYLCVWCSMRWQDEQID